MSNTDYDRAMEEIDRLLNDPEVPMQPDRIWSLLAEVAAREAAVPMHAPAE